MIEIELNVEVLSVEDDIVKHTIPGVVSGEDQSSEDGCEEEEKHSIAPWYIKRSRLQELKIKLLTVFKEIATKLNLLNIKTLCSLSRCLVPSSSSSSVCVARWTRLEQEFLMIIMSSILWFVICDGGGVTWLVVTK